MAICEARSARGSAIGDGGDRRRMAGTGCSRDTGGECRPPM